MLGERSRDMRDGSSMFLYSGGQSLLKTKNDDPGFEIVKEVPASMPRMGNPFFGASSGLLTSPNLANLASLMAGGSMSNMNNMSSLLSGAGGMGGLMSQSNMLQKCKLSPRLERNNCTKSNLYC